MNYFLGCILCYLIGAIPFSVIFSHILLNKDVRKYGSGNPGTSNMTRSFGLQYGLLVLIFDMFKGYAAVLLAQALMGPMGYYLGGVCAVVGHNWPIYLKFKGGKGVATTVGILLAHAPYLTLIGMACFVVVLLISGYFSLGSLVCLFVQWVLVLVFHFSNTYLMVMFTLLVFVSFYQHRTNIDRLIKGTEKKYATKQK